MPATSFLAKALQWGMKHPSTILGATGAAAGYIGSGGTFSGLMVGAGVGILGGRAGFTKFQGSGKRFKSFSRKAGNLIARNEKLIDDFLPTKRTTVLSSGKNVSINATTSWRKKHIGGVRKNLGAFAVGTGMSTGLSAAGGIGVGAAWGLGGHVYNQLSSATTKFNNKTPYGSTFSGMGNRSVKMDYIGYY